MTRIPERKKSQGDRQKGAALIISLILLLIMTILGLAGIRGITQQERMANQSFDRSLAFQATEAALREVEQLVETNNVNVSTLLAVAALDATSKCNLTATLRICAAPAATDEARWLSTSFGSWKSLTAVGVGALAVTPQYFVEFLGSDFECRPGEGVGSGITCRRYRVTARSHDGDSARSSVMLQSIYATD